MIATTPTTGVMPTAAVALAIAAILLPIVVYLAMRLKFERWKERYTREIRQDAAQRSQGVTVGKVYEQLVPHLPDFQWNPKDARFIGSPVDFLVFDGLNEGVMRSVVFVEVKTGRSALSSRERLVRDAILRGQVEWYELRLPGAKD